MNGLVIVALTLVVLITTWSWTNTAGSMRVKVRGVLSVYALGILMCLIASVSYAVVFLGTTAIGEITAHFL